MSLFRTSLKESLDKHKLWLESHGEAGQRFNMAGASFEQIDLRKANLIKANLSGTNLSEANLSEADLHEAILFGANLNGANLDGVNLSGASLSGAELQGASLQKAVLREAILCEANLNSANFSNADLHKANFSLGIPEFIKAKKIQALLSGAKVSSVDFYQTNLKESNLSGANLSEANLDFADLYAANLSGANLSQAKLFAANLNHADLSNANFYGADLFRVKACDANFSLANLTDACIEEWIIDSDTKFDGVNCQSIYLKHVLRTLPDYILRKYCDRRPFNSKATFAQGDFIKLIRRGNLVSELESQGSDILQQRVVIEELHQIFEYLSELYSHRYADASASDLQTLLRLEICYQAKIEPAFRLRLIEAFGTSANQELIHLLTDNPFVQISQETIQEWLSKE